CAYDSLLTILYNFWLENPRTWTRIFKDMNEHLSMLSDGFLALSNSNVSFEQIRDQWRTILHSQNPQRYPRGLVGISVAQLASETENGTKTLDLRGIVYHGQYHFTSRIISSQKQVWYHDGMTTGKSCSYDGMLNDMTDNDLRKCRQRYLSLAVYAQKL